MLRHYIVPTVGDGVTVVPFGDGTDIDRIRPKYFESMAGLQWGSQSFGGEPVRSVTLDITNIDHGIVSANADVISLPLDMTANPTPAQVTTIKANLEALKIPMGWVNTGLTFKQIHLIVLKIFYFHNSLLSQGLRTLFTSGVTLDTAFSALPANTRTKMLAAAQAKSFDTSSLSGASTVRQILKAMADQWTDPIKTFGVVH